MSNCEKEEIGTIEVGFGILVTTVLVISYLPQIAKLIITKNSYGISPHAQMLSFMSQTLTLFNIFLLQHEMINCCIIGKYGILYCLGSLIGVIQVFLQWSCITTIVYLFVKYFPGNINQEYTAIDLEGEMLIREWKTIVRIVYTIIVLLIIIISLTFVAIFMDWEATDIIYLAGIFGLGSTVFSLIQFLPQIRKTFINKSVGALSIPSMLIQCPGSFILVIFLAIQPGTNWTTWITYFAGGTLQGILLFLCIYYTYKNRSIPPQDELYENETDNSYVENLNEENSNTENSYEKNSIEISNSENLNDESSIEISNTENLNDESLIEISNTENLNEESLIEISNTENLNEESLIEISNTENLNEKNSIENISNTENLNEKNSIENSNIEN